MKKVILKSLGLAIAMTFGLGASAQCLNVNGNMESFTGPIITSPNTASNAWINNDLNNWYSSHGTPTTLSTPTTNMWMWSYSEIGEGVYTNYSFVNGTTYEICYDLWRDGTSNTNSVFRAAMTTGLTPNYSGTFGTAPPTPTTSQSLATQTWTGTGTWVTITETITANANYSQLWLYPYLDGTPVPYQAAARIDNICVKAVPLDPCDFEPIYKVITKEECNTRFDNITAIPAGFTILETSWDFGDGTTGTGLSVDHFYTATGDYEVCMTVWMINDEGECCKKEICKKIEAKGCDPCEWLKHAKIEVIGSNPFEFSVTNLPSGLYTLLGYHWDFGDGNFGTGNPVNHSYKERGEYKVCVTLYYYDVKREKCCSERVCIEVEAKEPKDVKDPKSMQGGGLEEGVNYENKNDGKLIALNEVIISPNPSNGQFEVRLQDKSAVNSITVYDQAGKVVYNAKNSQKTNHFTTNLESLESGVYIIIINETDDMTRSFSKLIIE